MSIYNKPALQTCKDVLKFGFVETVPSDIGICELCGNDHEDRYSFINGYSQQLHICALCGVMNIPFSQDDKFRLNNIAKGFLIIDVNTKSRKKLTVVTTSASVSHFNTDRISEISWVVCENNIYNSLVNTIKSSKSLTQSCFIIALGRRMHYFTNSIRPSVEGNLFIASEQSTVNINIPLLDKLIQKHGKSESAILSRLPMHCKFLSKPSFDAYEAIFSRE